MVKYNSPEWTDSMLLDLIRLENDRAAFAELYDRNWHFLYNSIYNILRHHEDTMDICQSLFLWIWENRNQIVIKTNFRAYLFVAAKYKVANLIRGGKVRETLFDGTAFENITDAAFDPLEVKELKNLIDQLINELPAKCREIFLMSREEELTHKQIAAKLKISERTVDEQISRALIKLRVPLGRLSSLILFL
ncbi:RNA polymerase sigma-70 factor (ECF subfamily) [Pedobacter sp. AK017]|uniref:RNA polymerase sigma factor n=1 Tax=Pedobacter sp. AK017 TaxID=2723073 RepID=UPI0016112C6B|nr:RNA polymerase sigma-70 factor [Pedobacter sp. AK017]MBB5441078.1 RNA polymerase sigma-70 factor (ECF subfamily) [Pedobacter sp. AK017]